MLTAVRIATLTAAIAFPMTAQESSTVIRLPVNGTIPQDFDILIQRVLSDATGRGAKALLLDLDVWQGDLDIVRNSVGWITDAEIPVYAFIRGIAHDVGALVALAADSIFMSPGSSIGGRVDGLLEYDAGLVNRPDQLRETFASLMSKRGLDPTLGEAMADSTVTIPGIAASRSPLTLTSQEAVTLQVSAKIVADVDELVSLLSFEEPTVISTNEYGFTGATIEIRNDSWRDARVYLVRDNTRRSLGLITSLARREFILAPEELALGTDARLVADPVGGAQDHVTQLFQLIPGIIIQWHLHNNPAQSNVFIFIP